MCLAEYLLITAFLSFRKGIDRTISVQKKKNNTKKSRIGEKHCLINGNLKEKVS